MATPKWKLLQSDKLVTVKLNGDTVARSKHPLLLIESPYEIVYYFPVEDVNRDLLQPSVHTESSAYRGEQVFWHVSAGGELVENGAWQYTGVFEPDRRPDLREYISFAFDAFEWYEEDDPIIGHPRNPFHRVDVRKSSRHIRVEIDGVTIAETNRPRLLFETGIPVRYYIPVDDVNFDYLTPTDRHTICPYKGVASYYSATVNGKTEDNIVWYYPEPDDESRGIKDMVAFYNEKVDIYEDGVLLGRPKTVFA